MSKTHTQKAIGTALCLVNKITNTVDGGCRVTLDIPPEGNKNLLATLLDLALNPKPIFVTFVESEK